MTAEDINKALDETGGVGKWQLGVMTIIQLSIWVLFNWNASCFIFLELEPSYFYCKIPDNITEAVYLNTTRPSLVSSCYEYGTNGSQCESGFDYVKDFDTSIVTEFNFVCDRRIYNGQSYLWFGIGRIIGNILFIPFTSYFGRIYVAIISTSFLTLFTLVQAFSPNVEVYFAMWVLKGLFLQGFIFPAAILANELFSSKVRSKLSGISTLSSILGNLTLILVAYFIRNWSYLLMALTIGHLVTIPFMFLVPESVIWLFYKGKREKTVEIIKRMAKFNGRTLPSKLLYCIENPDYQFVSSIQNNGLSTNTNSEISTIPESAKSEITPVPQLTKPETIVQAVTTPIVLTHLITTSLFWLMVAHVYYGITLYTSKMDGDVYVNFTILSTSDLLAIPLTLLTVTRFRRRTAEYIDQAICIVALLLMTILTTLDIDPVLIPILATIGKGGAISLWVTGLIHFSEIFPTSIRTDAYALTTSISFTSNFYIPYVNQLNSVAKWLPGLIYTLSAVVCVCVVSFLPETKGKPLLNDIAAFKKLHSGFKQRIFKRNRIDTINS